MKCFLEAGNNRTTPEPGAKPCITFNFIDDVKLIHGSYDDGVQYAKIILTFTAEGVQMLYEITRRNIDKPLVVVINQKVVSMPLV